MIATDLAAAEVAAAGGVAAARATTAGGECRVRWGGPVLASVGCGNLQQSSDNGRMSLTCA